MHGAAARYLLLNPCLNVISLSMCSYLFILLCSSEVSVYAYDAAQVKKAHGGGWLCAGNL